MIKISIFNNRFMITYSNIFFRFNGLFNWTMSYRRDSDIFAPYGWVALKGKCSALEMKNAKKELLYYFFF